MTLRAQFVLLPLVLPAWSACEPSGDCSATDPACEDGEPPADTCLPGGEPTVVIGTGETRFEPLDGDAPAVELVHGPQGGFHILVGLQATHLDTSVPAQGSFDGVLDGVLAAHTAPYLDFRCNGATDALETWGTFLIFYDEYRPEDLDGRRLAVQVEVTDVAGQSVEASRDVTIEDPNL